MIDVTKPLSGLAQELDLERQAHQCTMLELDRERDRSADLERRLDTMTRMLAASSRDLLRSIARERALETAAALDRAARAITGQSAADLNAALGIETRAHPSDFTADERTPVTDEDPDPKSLTLTELRSRIILLNEAASSSDDPVVRRSFEVEAASFRARLAIINARETQAQDAHPADDPAELRAEIATLQGEVSALTREREAWRSRYEQCEAICGRAVAAAAGLPPPAKPAVNPFADVVREAVRATIAGHGSPQFEGVFIAQRDIDSIADRVATALAAPVTDPERSMLGAWAVTEERTVMLRWARELFAKQPDAAGIRHSALADEMVNEAIGVSAPEVTIDPLPGVIQCNEWSAGCRSTIDRDALPGGWVLSAGLWICPLCQKRAPC